MKEPFQKEVLAQSAFERHQLETTEMLNSIEVYAWVLYCNVREFRVMLQNLEDVRNQLASR